MSHEWIKAPLALEYVSDGLLDYSARQRICERAHAGIIPAKAERIVWGGQEKRDEPIGKGFWWARGHEALEQDWLAGDFSTWIDNKIEVKAYGVSFDFVALSELVPADIQAVAMRKISVVGSENWISSHDLFRLMAVRGGPFAAQLLESCQLGQIGGRAMRARCFHNAPLNAPDYLKWGAIEWDIPLYFWRDFLTGDHGSIDWRLGKFSGRGGQEHFFDRIELQGVHFHRSGLVNLGLLDETSDLGGEANSRPGRRPKYDWPAASLHIFGLINRGDFKPECQADIERALIEHLTVGDNAPGESTVRRYAKLIWEENLKA